MLPVKRFTCAEAAELRKLCIYNKEESKTNIFYARKTDVVQDIRIIQHKKEIFTSNGILVKGSRSPFAIPIAIC